ncbi:hypothetical protein BpHYR1_008471 [Brachionus plicatilis]|uniref:Uncharacterized protein n=1 Tax=Brachionus plicatilis TaxID=10195 RepID=A0A3M7SAL8_BRAPC|nr:hypothetical protein BpHYR1_008471 [Brachionus plicatilis]
MYRYGEALASWNGDLVLPFGWQTYPTKENSLSQEQNITINEDGNENNLDSPRLPSCDAENYHHIPEDLSPMSQVMPVRSDSEDLSPSECNQNEEDLGRSVAPARIEVEYSHQEKLKWRGKIGMPHLQDGEQDIGENQDALGSKLDGNEE